MQAAEETPAVRIILISLVGCDLHVLVRQVERSFVPVDPGFLTPFV